MGGLLSTVFFVLYRFAVRPFPHTLGKPHWTTHHAGKPTLGVEVIRTPVFSDAVGGVVGRAFRPPVTGPPL